MISISKLLLAAILASTSFAQADTTTTLVVSSETPESDTISLASTTVLVSDEETIADTTDSTISETETTQETTTLLSTVVSEVTSQSSTEEIVEELSTSVSVTISSETSTVQTTEVSQVTTVSTDVVVSSDTSVEATTETSSTTEFADEVITVISTAVRSVASTSIGLFPISNDQTNSSSSSSMSMSTSTSTSTSASENYTIIETQLFSTVSEYVASYSDPTTLIMDNRIFNVTAPTALTMSDCPCTLSEKKYVISGVYHGNSTIFTVDSTAISTSAAAGGTPEVLLLPSDAGASLLPCLAGVLGAAFLWV